MQQMKLNPGRGVTRELASRTRAVRSRRQDAVNAAGLVARNDPTPELRLEDRALSELSAGRRRVRKAEAAHVAEVARAIASLGFSVPVLISGDGDVIDGHVRLEAARGLGLESVPCIVVDYLSPAELDLLKISINRLGEKGAWDMDALRLDFGELAELEIDLSLTGFSMPEIDIVLSLDGAGDGEGQDDADAEEQEELEDMPGGPVTRAGDLFLLGKHRLLCGDATVAENYARLMGGERAACLFTDPPYNIPIAGFVSPSGKHGDFAMGVGEMSDDAFRGFLARVLGQALEVMTDGGGAFACMDWRNLHLLVLAAKDVGLTHVNTAVWNKGVGGMGGLYRSAHEMVAVFANGPRIATNNVELGRHGRDRTNVWSYPGANRKGSSAAALLADHPTPKPVELVHDALLDVTRRGDIVLDPFLGSGTTIIAAHACGRIGYGMELDTRYADLIVRRWQARTGKEAVLENTGETFAQLAARREREAEGTPVPEGEGI